MRRGYKEVLDRRRIVRRWASLVAALGLVALTPSASRAQDNYWTFDGNGLWETSGNWFLGNPAPGQSLFINAGGFQNPSVTSTEIQTGTFSVGRLWSAADLAISGGSLTLTDNSYQSRIEAALVLNGGSLTTSSSGLSAGSLSFSLGSLTGLLEVLGSGWLVGGIAHDGTLNAHGELKLLETSILSGDSRIVAFDNVTVGASSLKYFETRGSFTAYGFTATEWRNSGGGTLEGQATITQLFSGLGSISGPGELKLDGSTGSFESGSWFDSNLTLNLAQATAKTGSTLRGAVEIGSGSTFTVDQGASVALGDLRLFGGTLKGTGNLRTDNGFQWTGGKVELDGTLRVAIESALDGDAQFGGNGKIVNEAGFYWQSGNLFGAGGSPLFLNDTGSQFFARSSGVWSAGTFENKGTLIKESEVTSRFDAYFRNSGLVNVNSGILELGGGVFNTGVLDSKSSLVRFSGTSGSFNEMRPGSKMLGQFEAVAGTLGFDGTDAGGATVDLLGTAKLVQRGQNSLLGSLRLGDSSEVEVFGGRLEIQDSSNFALNTVLQKGVFSIGGGTLKLNSLPIDTNDATVNIGGAASRALDQNDLNLFRNLSTNSGTFRIAEGFDFTTSGDLVNSGTLRSAAGSLFKVSGSLSNTGLIEAIGGTVEASGGGAYSGKIDATSIGLMKFTGLTHDFVDGAVLRGNALITSGVLNFQAGSDFNEAIIDNQGGTVNFLGGVSANLGSLTLKSGTFNMSNSTAFSSNLNVGGRLILSNGVLDIRGGGQATGIIEALSGARARFSGGTYEFKESAEVIGFTEINGGTVNLRDKSKLNGPVEVISGSLNTFGGALGVDPMWIQALGTLNVRQGELNVGGGLTNFNEDTRTLTGGTMNVFGGSVFRFSDLRIRFNAGTIGLYGAGSKFGLFNATDAGDDALSDIEGNSGTMDLADGAEVSIETSISNTGTMGLRGGSTFSSLSIISNSGTMSLRDLGTKVVSDSISNSGGMSLRQNSSGQTNSVGNSGTMLVTSGASLNVNGTYTQTGGSTIVSDGGTLSATDIDIQGGSFGGDGTLNGNIGNSGTMGPGASPGLLTVNGSYTQTSLGNLDIEVWGLSSQLFDRFQINGNANLGGTLTVMFGNGFQPIEGQSWQFMTVSGALSGQFQTLKVSGSSVPMRLVYGSNNVRLEAVPEPATLLALGAGVALLARRRRRA